MIKKSSLVISSVAVGLVVILMMVALALRGDKGLDFNEKSPEEIKAYFNSDTFRRLNADDQIAIKKQAYGPYIRQQEQAFIEQAKTYSKLPPQQKIRFLDERINEYIQAAEQKKAYASRKGSGSTPGTKAQGSDMNPTKPSPAKPTFTSEDYRAWSEKLDPEKRAHIMELKEALSRRMEERGIQIPGQGK